MQIDVQQLSKSWGPVSAVSDLNFSITEGQLVGLLGPSGGGKTTLLRMLAGLESPDCGEIRFDGRLVNGLPPQERGIGFVFQNYALFKHMTVAENIAFGLRVQKRSKAEISARTAELIELIGLAGLEQRYPHQLSGGQRQRVAFARALAPSPRLLLLDEPFAAIDAQVRKELRNWLRAMITRVGVTSIFVTHDQEEAVAVADEILVMNHGQLEQKGTPWEIFKAPRTPFVAGFIGETHRIHDLGVLLGFGALPPWAPKAEILVRPESVEADRQGQLQATDALTGTVQAVHFRGNAWQVEILVGTQRLTAIRALEKAALRPGDDVEVLIHRAHLFHPDTKEAFIYEKSAAAHTHPVRTFA
ncbi:sulfate transport system ATP-binding protein [Tumebacillus sp. BK434]|uniref:sulfate/molybdate ABC transporter ATP-binding protein n=1 Tax=Tumebacillus sp. BK434 TaxID=2512169 RepID=UPI0010442C43|nr:ABC transporter ATP-binding protein [Tumebacillus sp. BK434]TCP52165.1 sulfate transport system ATP-binding protein [Tumebacillus sp. BK434]